MSAVARADAEIVRRCRRGDPRAWGELIERFSPLVWRICLRALGAVEAEDASQEAFVRIYRYLDSFDATRPLGPWIARLTWNVCARRLDGRDPPGDPAALADLAAPDDPDVAIAGQEAGQALETALARLHPLDRVMLDLRYREGLSEAEVALSSGQSLPAVKTRLSRARARLRGWLTPILAGGEP